MIDISDISDKKYLTIGEVARFTEVPAHTLRYWEGEFKLLQPIRKNSKQRLYRIEDLELIDEIKDKLYNKRWTIEGVKKYFAESKKVQKQIIEEIYADLRQILRLLKRSKI